MKGRRTSALILLMGVSLLVFICACGRKAWPTPQEQEDVFSFSSIKVEQGNGCITLRGQMEGAYFNLTEMVLEIEWRKGMCRTCPFYPEKKIIFYPHTKHLEVNKNAFILTYCPVRGKEVGRLRLVGINRFGILEPVYSRVIEIANNKQR